MPTTTDHCEEHMLTIRCPWCHEPEPVNLADIQVEDAEFTCLDCGTSVRFVDETTTTLELAA